MILIREKKRNNKKINFEKLTLTLREVRHLFSSFREAIPAVSIFVRPIKLYGQLQISEKNIDTC